MMPAIIKGNDLILQIYASLFEATNPELYGSFEKDEYAGRGEAYVRTWRAACDVFLESSRVDLGNNQIIRLEQRGPLANWATGLLKNSYQASIEQEPILFRLFNMADQKSSVEFVGFVSLLTPSVIELVITEGVRQVSKNEFLRRERFVDLFKKDVSGQKILAEIGDYLGGTEKANRIAEVLPPRELFRQWLLSQGITADADLIRQMLNAIHTYKPQPKEEWHVAGDLHHMEPGAIPDESVPLWADRADWNMVQSANKRDQWLGVDWAGEMTASNFALVEKAMGMDVNKGKKKNG